MSSKTDKDTNVSAEEILVVASKLKRYIRESSGLNTSSNTMKKLSEIVRDACDQAVDNAKSNGRKTVMDRDFV